ncbi:MAG TPA: tetratricopeptide repeat protein [Flavobacterium sp.]|jgi:tetratricopeptide (TPR) repeat protein
MKFSSFFKTLLPLFVLLLNSGILYSQEEFTRAHCDKLIAQGNAALNVKRDAGKALEHFTKAEFMAEKMNWNDKLAAIKTGLGNTYSMLSNYGDALGYYQQALKLAEDSKNDKSIASVLGNLGLMYAEQEDYETALRYYQRANIVATSKSLESTPIPLAINISDIYNILGDYKQARKYLDNVKGIVAKTDFEQVWKVNYAETYLVEGDLTKAQKLAEDLISSEGNRNTEGCYDCIVELLSKIYTKQQKTDKAIHFAGLGLKHSSELVNRVRLYQRISDLYIQKGQFHTAIKYRDSAASTKDSMAILINRGLFEANKVKMKVQEYQTQLQITQQKQQTQQNLFIALIVAGFVASYLIYRGLKSKIVRQNQEKLITKLEFDQKKKEQLIVEKELENTKNNALLDQEVYKNSIAEKNRQLSAKALYLSIRNELIENTISSLGSIPEVAKNKAVADQIKLLTTHLKSDAEWEDFISHFEKTNPSFLQRLKQKHPELNPKDIRFICCIFMNLDTKEVSNIFNITYDAAHKRKHRIMEKMAVTNSLYEYLVKMDFELNETNLLSDKLQF